MFSHEFPIRVRYGETDQMGYVYYGNYGQYYEVGRAEAMRSLGLSYREVEEKMGIIMPVMSMEIQYLRPAFYDEELKVVTTLKEMPKEEIIFYTEIYNEKNKIVNKGTVKLCFVDPKVRQRVDAPAYMTDKLQPFFQ